MTTLEQMRKLMASTKNFGEYRETLHLANPPCIPFFGESRVRESLIAWQLCGF
jgi:hypothetical protein